MNTQWKYFCRMSCRKYKQQRYLGCGFVFCSRVLISNVIGHNTINIPEIRCSRFSRRRTFRKVVMGGGEGGVVSYCAKSLIIFYFFPFLCLNFPCRNFLWATFLAQIYIFLRENVYEGGYLSGLLGVHKFFSRMSPLSQRILN